MFSFKCRSAPVCLFVSPTATRMIPFAPFRCGVIIISVWNYVCTGGVKILTLTIGGPMMDSLHRRVVSGSKYYTHDCSVPETGCIIAMCWIEVRNVLFCVC